jgi:hypothetical protein
VANIFLLERVISPFKMTTANNPTGDSGGRSNPTNRATPEGGGSKATSDPQGNPVSISNPEVSKGTEIVTKLIANHNVIMMKLQ